MDNHSKAGLADRVNTLPVDVTNIARIDVISRGKGATSISNEDGKRNSLKIYAGIVNEKGIIGTYEAGKGLAVFGKELIDESIANPGKHPSIDTLLSVSENPLEIRITGFPWPIPFSKEEIELVVDKFGSPVHLYDEAGIRNTARQLKKAFSWVPGKGYKNYFAVKACPNPILIDILRQEGMGADCSSMPELMIADRVGIKKSDIMFTSNDTPAEEFVAAKKLGAILNLDDITHLEFLESALYGRKPYSRFDTKSRKLPELICFRYNPGTERTGNAIIGNPVDAKYGLTKDQIFEAYRLAKNKGIKKFGLHTMVASNELNPEYFVETGRMLLSLVAEISKKEGITFEFVNIGGGIGIPYRPYERPVDLDFVSKGIQELYKEHITGNGLPDLRIFSECGRMVTGPHGFLATKVRHVTKKHKNYVGVDACMANLMRPALYGSYHHITVLGKTQPLTVKYDVTGSLCENNDKFAINRFLPEIEQGDILLFHNTGAHGYAMGFQYNGKLRSPEVLATTRDTFELIRRGETAKDYFATMKWPKQSRR